MRAPSTLLAAALLLSGCGASEGTETPTPSPTPGTPTEAPTPTATPGTPTPTGSDTPTPTGSDTPTPATLTYAFESAFVEGSSVSYGGQIMRHLLIEDMKAWIGTLTARIDGGSFIPAQGDVTLGLNFYYRFDSDTGGDIPFLYETSPEPLQMTYSNVSTDKDLSGKIAGNDPGGQHKDWSEGFVGWPAEGVDSPEALVEHLFDLLDGLSVDRANGTVPTDLSGAPLPAVYLTGDGLDLQQLLQKFLTGAIAFSQGTDDYLDDDEAGKGILADNTAPASEGGAYTALEHAWDEGVGYFGAAQDYLAYTDDEIAAAGGREGWSSGVHDTNADGAIDLLSEVNFGHSTNAAKRDRGSAESAPTDFSEEAFLNLLEGRRLIADAAGQALSDAQLTELKAHRDAAVLAWEKAISATVVHYLNDMIQDLDAYDDDAFSFTDYAKHFSEMKGFALSLQFNPRSPLSDDDFAALHAHVGIRPVMPDAEGAADYRAALLAARTLVGDAYGFDAANLGDDDGQNGW